MSIYKIPRLNTNEDRLVYIKKAMDILQNGYLDETMAGHSLYEIIKDSHYQLPAWLFLVIYGDASDYDEHEKIIEQHVRANNFLALKYALYKLRTSPNLFLHYNNQKNMSRFFTRLKVLGLDFNFIFSKDLVSEIVSIYKERLLVQEVGASCAQFFIATRFFEDVLFNGASPWQKSQFVANICSPQENRKLTGYSYINYQGFLKKQSKKDNLDCVEYALVNQNHGALKTMKKLGLMKGVIPKDLDIQQLQQALFMDNDEVLKNLSHYRDIIWNGKISKKNLLFYAIERANMKWIEVLVEQGMVSKDDVGYTGQQALFHALCKHKSKIALYLYEKRWIAGQTFECEMVAWTLFEKALENCQLLAIEMELSGLFSFPGEKLATNIRYNSIRYQKHKRRLQKQRLESCLEIKNVQLKKRNKI